MSTDPIHVALLLRLQWNFENIVAQAKSELAAYASAWWHSYEQDEETRRHTYCAKAIIAFDKRNIVISRDFLGDDQRSAPPELEQAAEQWCEQFRALLKGAQIKVLENEACSEH